MAHCIYTRACWREKKQTEKKKWALFYKRVFCQGNKEDAMKQQAVVIAQYGHEASQKKKRREKSSLRGVQ